MEPHKLLNSEFTKYKPDLNSTPTEYYEKAREFAFKYYSEEINRIQAVAFETLTQEKFFQEYIWVVHATGFSAKAVGNFVVRLMEAYGNIEECALRSEVDTLGRVLVVCNNPQKAKAIIKTSRLIKQSVDQIGWEATKAKRLSSPELLSELPYVGKVTCFHLARNTGQLDSVKPDLHLVRMAQHWGYESAQELISAMKSSWPEPLGIVDLIVWYAASTFGTITIKQEGSR